MDEEYKGSSCAGYEALLEDFVSGELGGADAKSLAEHLKGCNGCRAAFQEAAASVRLLRVAEPTPDPGPGFARAVMARIRAEQSAAEGRSFWQPFISMAWRFAATAALSLVALMTYDVTGHTGLGPTAAIDRQADSRDLFNSDPANPPRNSDDVLMLVAESQNGKH
jgi:anti-sigma factor RsiW